MESLAPALVDSMESVVEHFPAGSLVILDDPERLRRRSHDLVATTGEFLAAAWTSAAGGADAPLDLGEVDDLGLSGASADRKSTRLNSSHVAISYDVFCLH